MKKWFYVLTALLLVTTIVSACGKASEPSSTSSANGTGDAVTGSKATNTTLTIAMGTDMVSFDIHDHNNTSTEAIHVNLFNYLFKFDENQQLQPELAESYKLVDDTTWEITLRQGVKFHDGTELTAEDVKFTLERVAKDSALREHPNYKQILEVKVLEDYKVQILTDGPQPALLNRLARLGSGILPKAYIEEKGWETFLEHPIGTGPYQFVEWVRDDRVVLERFTDYYFGGNEEWERVVFRVIPEASTRVNELLTGGVQIAMNVPPNDWERIDNNDGTHVALAESNRVMFLVVRHTEGTPTADPRVREAIDYAIDDKALAEQLLGGAGVPTRTRVTPGNIGANPNLYNDYLYDPEKAKTLLAEAGYPNGLTLTLHSPQGRYLQDREVAEMIVAYLGQVGIQVNLDFMEWSNFVEMRKAKNNKELYLIGIGNSLFDADLVVDFYHSQRAAGEIDYANAEVDQLIEAARINMNAEEREKQYQRIQEIIAEDRPHIHLYLQKSNYGVSDSIQFAPRLDEMIIATEIKRK
ncbi:ABC transporter substrate-binding protein [Rubeoparvulum massiliense]|uniref:ABC transporter substrate-binding protein n=1 Tax=Rubeoparvulum massiliense TaxID=1631346 RepID=UPI00065DD6F5|nr:ABC transporter substrate-binding protein [Rubeoparvulum massiliense]